MALAPEMLILLACESEELGRWGWITHAERHQAPSSGIFKSSFPLILHELQHAKISVKGIALILCSMIVLAASLLPFHAFEQLVTHDSCLPSSCFLVVHGIALYDSLSAEARQAGGQILLIFATSKVNQLGNHLVAPLGQPAKM
jgi:hypothetical protein